jgi:hypothetical protein
LEGALFSDIVKNHWKTAALGALLAECLHGPVSAVVKLNANMPSAGEFKVNAQPFIDHQTKETLMVLIIISEG